jgi:3-hydroxymyristoyl/3-hydroxydecanoyl-(acyl carrier protein) dehydratase
MRVPLELDCWPGHFPNWSVVPGVLQLDWVIEIIAKWLGCVAIEAAPGDDP